MILLRLILALGPLAAEGLATPRSINSGGIDQAESNESTDSNKALWVPKPSQDPWYKPPTGWESEAPGAVLRVRDHAYQGVQGISGSFDVFQVQYKTTDSHKRPSYAVTTVFMPDSHKKCAETFRNVSNPQNCSYALVSYQLPYDSACVDAAPSYGMQGGEPYGDVGIMLRRGYFVSVPDFEGPKASYGANILAGYALLDQFRALKAVLGNYGFKTNSTKFAMWGYSSGAAATEFAAELAFEYAPDVKLDGVIIGGVTGNMTESLELVNGHDVSGLMVNALIGLTAEYPEQREFMDSRLKREGSYNITEFYMATQLTGVPSGLAQYLYHNVYEYFKNGREDVFAPIMLLPLIREGNVGLQGTPFMPVFMYQAVHDEMCPIKSIDDAAKQYCGNGANIWFQRNILGGHNAEGTNGRQRGLNFLTDVVEGTNTTGRPEKGCRIENVIHEQDARIPFY
jgi:hypothetical protein